MEIRGNRNLSRRPGSLNHSIIVGCMAVCACLLGAGAMSAGSGSANQVLIVTVALATLLGGAIAFVLEIPLIGFFRAAYIASFFFKSDMSFFKIDEIEDPSGFNISATLILGLILVAYDFIYEDEGLRVFPASFISLILGLVVCATVSVLYAGPVLLGVFSLASLLTSILIAYVTALHFGRANRLVFLIKGLGAGVLFTGLVALAQYAVEWPLNLAYFGTGTEGEQLGTQSIELSRVPAFLRTPTGMAWVVSALVPIVIAPVICRVKTIPHFQKILLAASGFAGIIAIILSLARGSWIGMVVALALLAVFGWWRLTGTERKSYFIWAGGTLVILCALLSPFAIRIFDRLTEDDQGSGAIRLPLMENAIRMIDDHPIVGVGLNGYRANMTKYDETGIFVSRVFPNPVHNIFIHVTTEVGIPGGIIFCLLVLASLWECFKATRVDDRLLFALGLGTAIGLLAFCISGIKEPGSLGSVRTPTRICFLLFGLAIAIRRACLRHQGSSSDHSYATT